MADNSDLPAEFRHWGAGMAERGSLLMGQVLDELERAGRTWDAEKTDLVEPLRKLEQLYRDRAETTGRAESLGTFFGFASLIMPSSGGGLALQNLAADLTKLGKLRAHYMANAEALARIREDMLQIAVEDRDSALLIVRGFKQFFDDAKSLAAPSEGRSP